MNRARSILVGATLVLSAAAVWGKDDSALFLGLKDVGLGKVTDAQARNEYWTTIQLEKLKIQRKMLSVVYDNAYDLYKQGDYDGASALAAKVLSIDPAYDDAVVLKSAAQQLRGSARPALGERQMIEDRIKEGLELYGQRRLVEAERKLEEASKLNPANLKARYWLRKVQKELAEEHLARGDQAYRERHLQDALDQWYATLLLSPGFPGLTDRIAKAETEQREEQANARMEDALKLYSQGRLEDSMAALRDVLQVTPGEPKAERLAAELKGELAGRHIANGDKLYNARKFAAAIDEWERAERGGYDPRLAEARIERAHEMMRRETDLGRRKAALAKRRQEEAAAKSAEEAKQEAEQAKQEKEEAAANPTPVTGAAPAAPTPSTAAPAGVISAVGVTQITPEQQARMSEENKRNAQQHYLNGVVFFQEKQYDKAKYEWNLAKQLDPSNPDVDAGLRRIDALISGGP